MQNATQTSIIPTTTGFVLLLTNQFFYLQSHDYWADPPNWTCLKYIMLIWRSCLCHGTYWFLYCGVCFTVCIHFSNCACFIVLFTPLCLL